MKIILKQDVDKLGRKGDVVNVAAGYGRNFLIPRKLGVEVTPTNVKMIEIERQALKKRSEKEHEACKELTARLNQVSLTFRRKSGEKDVIFGSVQASDIKEELDRLGFDIDKKKIVVEEPIKRLGEFSVPVKVCQEERAGIKVVVVAEEAGPAVQEQKKED